MIIVGGGRPNDVQSLLKVAESYTVTLVIKSRISDIELWRLYSESKVYVNTAIGEPFGMTSLEAVCSGLNLVTIKECGTLELKPCFPKNVISCKNTIEDISKGITIALAKKNVKPYIPYIFQWKQIAKEILK